MQLKNPQEKFHYATVKNSAAEEYFRTKAEYSLMYRTMLYRNYDTAQDAIDDIRDG